MLDAGATRPRNGRGLRTRLAWLGPLIALALPACSGGEARTPVYPVKGTLQFKGQPAAGAFVVFHSVGPTGSPEDERPTSLVGPDGSFTLTTFDPGDGAPEGEYVVTVEWRKLVGKGNDVAAGPNVIPQAYGDPKTSPLRAKVAAAENDLPPFQITK